jgi:hypothetical protein
MQDCKFKSLVIDIYNTWNDPEHTTTGISMGTVIRKRNFLGIIYGAISSDGFNDMKDIIGYMNTMNPNMLYLKSSLDNSEIQVYDYELTDYKVNKDNIWIKLSNREVTIQI